MKSKLFRFPLLLTLFLGMIVAMPLSSRAARPFKAPARFDFSGSSMNMKINFNLGHLGKQTLQLNPSPTPVTGFIDIDKLSAVTGICSGRMLDISASTKAGISKMGVDLDFTVTAAFNSDPLEGIFFWNKDKAAFYPENLIMTLSFDSESWDIPLSEIPLPTDYRDETLSLDIDFEYEGEYEGYQFSVEIVLHLKGELQKSGDAGADVLENSVMLIELELDKDLYQSGDRLRLRAGLNNLGEERQVDVYVAFFDHEGNYFFAPDYTGAMTPLLRTTLGANQYTSLTEILDVHLPSHSPPIAAAGDCSFCAVVTAAGGDKPISSMASAAFSYNPTSVEPAADPFAGEWHGQGGSAVPGGDCPALAVVHMTVTGNRIDGFADETGEIEEEDESYKMTGTINESGEIVNGILLEEYMNNWVPVGSFSGTFTAGSCMGSWIDEYGCYGTFSVSKVEQD